MSGVLTKSLASWRESHGFGILDIISPEGETFWVETRPTDASGFKAWEVMSERDLRAYLSRRGLSGADIDDAIQLSREWATTVTGMSFFPPPAKSN